MRFAACLLGLCVVLQGSVSAAPRIEQWHTENSVRTLFVAAPELPMLDIGVTFDAGSGRDARLPGLSLLTHSLLNTGTPELDADAIAEKFEDVGAEFGTGVKLDRSSISLRSLTDDALLEQALSTYIAVITQPVFPGKDFQRLRNQALTAIKDEQQRPGSIASKAFYRALYGDHPYAQPVSGDESSIQTVTLEDVREFHGQYLVAENAVIAIVGGIDTGRARQISERIASSLPRGTRPDPIAPPVPRLPAQDLYIPYPSRQSHVYLGQLGIARGDPDYFTLYTGNYILGGGGFSARLMKTVRVELGLSYSVYSYFFPLKSSGPFILGLQTHVDQAQQALDVSLETVEAFVRDGPGEEELELAKKSIIGGFPLRIDSNRDILGYLSMIAYYGLPLDYLESFSGRIAAVTLADIREAFGRRLHGDQMVRVVVGGPDKE